MDGSRRPWARNGTRRALAAVAACAAMAGTVPDAEASTLLELIGAPLGRYPFGARVLPSGPEAAYFNPALLPGVEGGFVIGVSYLHQELDIDLAERPDGIDVTDAVFQARRVDPVTGDRLPLAFRPLPTSMLAPRGDGDASSGRPYLSLGTVMHFWGDRIGLGVYGALPAGQFQGQRPFFADEREQYFSNSLHFELLGDRTEGNAIVVALGIRPIRWVSAGIGVTIANRSEVNNKVFVPESGDQTKTMSTSQVVVRTKVAPHFALAVHPIPRLAVTGTVHLESRSDVAGGTEMAFWAFDLSEDDKSVHAYVRSFLWEPLRVGFGASWDGTGTGDWSWKAGVGGVWGQWSRYRERQGVRPLDRWKDTVSLSASGEVSWRNQRLSLDLGWFPSPVPDQVGRSNHVDNDRLGVGAAWDGRWQVGKRVHLTAGVNLSFQHLFPRSVRKSADAANPVIDEMTDDLVDRETGLPLDGAAGLQTNNPGYPGFSSRGWLINAGVSLRIEY